MFALDENIKAKILNAINICSDLAEKEHEHEQCGIIVQGDAIALRNHHPEPCHHFHLSPQELYPYQDNIQAIFHTHCREIHDGYLSYDDIRTAQMSNLPVIMYHTLFDSWDYYDPADANPFPLVYPNFNYKDIQSYLGIPAHWGRSDCFAIARSFYLGMFAVDVGEFPRCELDTFPLDDYQCPWAGGEFTQVSKHEELKVYDAIAIAMRGGVNPNHVGILLPDNMMLHSPIIGGLSKVESYGNFWRKRTIYIKRIIDNAVN